MHVPLSDHGRDSGTKEVNSTEDSSTEEEEEASTTERTPPKPKRRRRDQEVRLPASTKYGRAVRRPDYYGRK